MAEFYGANWNAFREEFGARAERLAQEIAASWHDLNDLLEGIEEGFAWAQRLDPARGTVASLQSLFEDVGSRLLFDPLDRLRRARPLKRAFSALLDFDSGLNDLTHMLPAELSLSGQDLAELTGDSAGWRRQWHRWRWSRGPVPLRSMAKEYFERQTLARARLDGAAQLTMARSCLHLFSPWQILMRCALRGTRGEEGVADALATEWKNWKEIAARNSGTANHVLNSYREWAGKAGGQLGTLSRYRPAGPAAGHTPHRRAEEHQRHLSHWSRQLRAVTSVLDLGSRFSALACDLVREAADSLDTLEREHSELVAELDTAIEWLRDWPEVAAPDAFPPPGVRLLPAVERAAQQQERFTKHARSRLPSAVEAVDPRRALPGWWRPWRQLEPERLFTSVLSAAPPIALEGFREAEAKHRAMVREIERAREVVTYGMETARDEAERGESLLRESVRNALALLQHQRTIPHETHSIAEESAVRDLAGLLLESHWTFEKGRLGLIAYLTRQRGSQAVRQARGLLLNGLRSAARRSVAGARRSYRWSLVKAGWLTPPRPEAEPVNRRASLAEIFDLEIQGRDLPAIYRRLFRLEPVEEARFLVGRKEELDGLEEAFQRWQSGRPASVVVVGARGSGKTSLLNCAVSGLFTGTAVVRGQFSERITSRMMLRQFLARLVGAPEGMDLAGWLAATRRVVVIEELERTYLRAIGGFEALREFLDIIHSTSRSTLWILSVNESAFRFLDAVTGLGKSFSHRVNAMSVAQEDLTQAILQRHNLSGLRLEFAALPKEDPRVSRARWFLGLEQDAQRLFFDALFRQSEGLFRAGLELWQESIERVEGGVVYMRQPLVPDYRRLYLELTPGDYFSLKAVLQHGSLTVEEHAQVMRITLDDSRRRLERLEALDILELETGSPGMRIRPEAGRFVRGTLHRQNLL